MQKIFKLISLLGLFATVSCSEHAEFTPTQQIKVEIGSSPKVSIDKSRTSLEEDGFTVNWCDGDKVALWAEAPDHTMELSGQTFSLLSFGTGYNSASFSANIAPMAAESYNYYAVSPLPITSEGTIAKYAISESQNGAFNGDYDIMVADPTLGAAPLMDGDNSDVVDLKFTHKLHLLKIRIPEGGNMLGEPINKMEITFPEAVAGDISVDITDPTLPLHIENGKNTITLNLDRPISDGDNVIAMIAPINIDPEMEVIFRAYSQNNASMDARMAAKNFMSGHTTPIALSVEPLPPTIIVLPLGDNMGALTLGETITKMTITAPAGLNIGGSTNKAVVNTISGNTQSLVISNPVLAAQLSGKTLTIAMESDNAIVSTSVTLPTLVTSQSNTLANIAVPYLYVQDFSKMSESGNIDIDSGSNKSETINSIGWIAASRARWWAKSCVGVSCYSNLGGPFQARISSCLIPNLKNTSTSVKLKVQFNADWNKNKSKTMKLLVGRGDKDHYILNSTINDPQTITMSDVSNASPTHIPTPRTVVISGFTKDSHRVTWKSSGSNGSWFNYEDLYIDNVKISITK